mgnify:CR=1 FL=1
MPSAVFTAGGDLEGCTVRTGLVGGRFLFGRVAWHDDAGGSRKIPQPAEKGTVRSTREKLDRYCVFLPAGHDGGRTQNVDGTAHIRCEGCSGAAGILSESHSIVGHGREQFWIAVLRRNRRKLFKLPAGNGSAQAPFSIRPT